jgi:tetratricopeptide (TPR) repeat protein
MLRIAIASLALMIAVPAAVAQPKDKKQPPSEKEQAPEQVEAVKLFNEGQELEKAGDFDGAIAKYEEAYQVYPDALLYARIANAHQLKGNANNDFDAYRKAVESYQKLLELLPEGTPEDQIAQVNERITQLEAAIKAEEERKAKDEEDAKQRKLEEERERQEAELEHKKQADRLEGMRPAFNAMVVSGVDQDISAVARLVAGGFLGWGRFALEGHLTFEGFLRVDNTKGVSGRSVGLDLGTRIGLGSDINFRGPFLSVGGSFGLYSGKPRERKLADAMETCMGFDSPDAPGTCAFDIDKNITGRAGFGYGFAASDKTTVAARLDFTYWLFSVDGSQSAGSVPAARVDKPQQSYSILVGLEFMRWFR